LPGRDDPSHLRDEPYRVSDLDLRDRDDQPTLAEQVEVSFAVGGKGWQRRMVLIAVGLEAGVDLGVPDVRVLPAPVGELHGILEVRFGQEARLVPVQSDLLEASLQSAVHVTATPPALLEHPQQV